MTDATPDPALAGDAALGSDPGAEARPAGARGGLGDRLESLLVDQGAAPAEVADARRHGHLGLLAVERLVLPEPLLHDLDTVARRTGLDPELVATMWRSLGFVAPEPGERIYTDADIEFMASVGRLLETRLVDDDLVIQVARVMGSSLARMASAFVDAIEASAAPVIAEEDREASDLFAAVAPDLFATVAGVNDHAFRRHVRGEARARIVRDHAGADPAHRVVGFADLVGFTALSQQVDAHELAEVVHRFETIAYDTVGEAGGRVVKMIGDEVMFAVEDEATAAELGLTLAEAYRGDDRLADVRVGLAAGPVLTREADLFGPVVNRASRLVGLAHPGTVLVDEAVHDALAGRPDLAWRSLGNRSLKHIGKVPIFVLRRAPGRDGGAPPR